MNFIEMLLMSRKLAFEQGRISLYGKGVLLLPTPAFYEYMLAVNNEVNLIKYLYSNAKEAMIAEYEQNFTQTYKESESANWICNNINLYGQGKVNYEDPKTAPLGAMAIDNSPFANYLKGKVKGPIDHILRGIIAGTVSAVLKKDIDVIELNCTIDQGTSCKMVVNSKEELNKAYPTVTEQQIA